MLASPFYAKKQSLKFAYLCSDGVHFLWEHTRFSAPLYLGTDGGDDGKDVIINVTGKESYDYSQSG